MSDSKHESVYGPPSPKRPKVVNPPSPLSNLSGEDGDEEEEEEDNFDPDSFYTSSSPAKLAEPVQKFMQSALKHCIPRRKRRQLGSEYPRPDLPAAKVPKLDPDIVGALADDFKGGEDKQLMKIQASVLASSSPLANFWSHLTEQGFEGKDDEYVAVGEVLDVIKASLILIRNALHYITQSRRKSIIESTKKSRPSVNCQLSSILYPKICNSPQEQCQDFVHVPNVRAVALLCCKLCSNFRRCSVLEFCGGRRCLLETVYRLHVPFIVHTGICLLAIIVHRYLLACRSVPSAKAVFFCLPRPPGLCL